MCKQPTVLCLCFTTLASLVLGSGLPMVNAQVVDIAAEARASRDRLAAKIAAVDGAELRSQLVDSADNERLARWYAGEVLISNQWLTLEQAQAQASHDKQFTAYNELRKESSDRLADHERLARWCKKRKLYDLANMHWLHVLRFDSDHRAALSSALELIWHQGMLMTEAEAKQYTIRQREWIKQKREWQAKAKRLRRELEKGDPAEQIAAQQELREVRDPEAVPALLEEFGQPAADEKLTLNRRTDLISVLGGIDSSAAVETLVQLAVESTYESIRHAAIDQLKSKPLENYVPALLAGMAMPVEASVSINSMGNRVVGSYSYSQAKPGGGEYTENRYSTKCVPGARYRPVQQYRIGNYVPARTIKGSSYKVPITPGHGSGFVPSRCGGGLVRRYGEAYLREVKTPDIHVPGHYAIERVGVGYAGDPTYALREHGVKRQMQQQAAQLENKLEQHNRATQFQNERIASVLIEVTGETLNAYPKSWWNWWSSYLDQNPDIATAGTRQQLNRALLNQQVRGLARGTWVWTQQGKRTVEEVLLGDFVLAQHPQTGELAYQVVLAVSQPQQLTVSKVEVGDAELFCVPGHVVWTTGSGWQRVSNLRAGQSLHGATTEARVARVDKSFAIDSYDLIIDGFHTFFVGEQGVLVHDATPIAPTHVALPGFSPAAVAEAVKLVAVAR